MTGKSSPLEVDTVNGLRVNNSSVAVNLQICSVSHDATFDLRDVRSVPRLPVSISSMASPHALQNYEHLNDIILPACEGDEVDLLIGSNFPDVFMITDHRYGEPGEPYAQQFPLGWTIIGPVNNNTATRHTVNLTSEVTNSDLSDMFSKLWKYDFPDASSISKQELSVEDKIAQKIVNDSLIKEDGRYKVKFPFRSLPLQIPNNKSVAEVRMKYLHRKLLQNKDMKDAYVKTMESYLTDGYARPLRNDEIQEEKSHGIWYVPHHGVVNPKKPGKVRVVFDCASKFKGKSINDHMYTGPDVLNTLLGVLLRFRQERVAIVGDVEAMYHRVKVYEEDERFLRFLWWKDGNLTEKASQFCMTVNIFGAAPSGFIANTALRRCADDGIETCHPDVVKSVHENFYVDDYLMSVPDETTAIFHVKKIRRLLLSGGFRLHKWRSTSKRVLETIEPSERAGAVKEINDDTELPRERALGVH